MNNIGSRPYTGRFFMFIIALFTLGWHANVLGQKKSVRTFDADNLTKLDIDAERIYEVELESSSSGQVVLEVYIEGEYQSELTVSAREEGSTLFLKGVFMPSFKNPNDKLSAHKVLSVRVKVYVPRHLNTELYGTSTRVVASGYYEDLEIRTQKGPVVLRSLSGLVSVQTNSGVIKVFETGGALQASSSYGTVNKGDVPEGNSSILLESVNGDIYINKPE